MRDSGPRWTGEVELIEKALGLPLHWRKPRKIFVNSTSDLFHEELTITDIEKVFRVMLSAPQHTYQILTKRADIMAFRVPIVMNRIFGMHWRMPDFIWLGVSVENQSTADARIPHLLATPAEVRFVSAEPLLSSLDLLKWLHDDTRTGVFGSSSSRMVQSLGGRGNLPPSEVCGRRREEFSSDFGTTRGTELFTERRISAGDVPIGEWKNEDRRSSNRMDDLKQGGYTVSDGDQSQEWDQVGQLAAKFRTSDSTGERAAFIQIPSTEEEGSARRTQCLRETESRTSSRDFLPLGVENNESTRNRDEIRSYPERNICGRNGEIMGNSGLDLIIVGGESGPGARSMEIGWARSIVDQCKITGTACFMKQICERGKPIPFDQFPEDLQVREFPNGQ
jgi:protein gp37